MFEQSFEKNLCIKDEFYYLLNLPMKQIMKQDAMLYILMS